MKTDSILGQTRWSNSTNSVIICRSACDVNNPFVNLSTLLVSNIVTNENEINFGQCTLNGSICSLCSRGHQRGVRGNQVARKDHVM